MIYKGFIAVPYCLFAVILKAKRLSGSQENFVFVCLCTRLCLSLFHEDRMRLGSLSLKSKLLAWNCARLSLSL